MDTSQNASDTSDNDIIEIIPLEEYDSTGAKLKASISWVIQKAYGNNIPQDFVDPFYETDTGNWLIKPILVNALTSSEVYCHACRNIFPDVALQRHGHSSILQILSRKSIYIMDSDDIAVTETVLQKTAPVHVKGHLALIRGLMMAYSADTVNVENVVQAVKRITSFNASTDLPTNVEDSVILWINKVCSSSQFTTGQQLIQGETNQKVRIRSRTPVREPYPVINHLSEDIGDGSSLACLISFYCPKHLKFSDICLKESLGIADSLYNLRLVRTFCDRHLPIQCFHFTYEDLLYSTNKMRENIIVLLADLFYLFEINPASCVQRSSGRNEQENADGRNGLPLLNSASKKSSPGFYDNRSTTPTSPTKGSYLPLLQRRQPARQQLRKMTRDDGACLPRPGSKGSRRAQSLSAPRDREIVHESLTLLAWQDRHSNETPSLPSLNSFDRDGRDSKLLANVSIDSEIHDSYYDPNIDLDFTPRNSRQSLPTTIHDPHHPDYMEIESVTSSRSRMSALPSNPIDKPEPLTPARLKTPKERVTNHSKAEERGHGRRKATSPTKPKKKTANGSHSPAPEDMLVTPTNDEQLSWRSPESNGTGNGEVESFYINTDSDSARPEVKSSYTVPDQVYNIHSARAAGLPVVEGADDYRRFHSREGSVASSRSSGDYSDHESHKIHYDHKAREMEDMKSLSPAGSSSSSSKPTTLLITDKLPPASTSMTDRTKRPHTTNFAEIKRLKETYGGVDNSGLVYMQHGQDRSPSHTSPLKSAFLNKQPEQSKKTSFAQLPTETTWQQRAQHSANQNQSNSQDDDLDSPNQPLASELMSLRMKLDEKRKEIERKKHRSELQQQKMRQRMGKAAFLQVVSKHIPDKDGPEPISEEPESSHSQRLAADVRERLGQMSLPGQRGLGDSGEAQRPTSLGDMPSSGAGAGQGPRLSRSDVSKTSDPVKKKWFKEDEMSTSANSLPDRRDSNPDSHRDSFDGGSSRSLTQSPAPRAPSMEGSDHSSHSRGSNPSVDEYGGSLDRLNRSLTQLQGEIAHLSLQHQQQLKSGRTPTVESQLNQFPDSGQSLPQDIRQSRHRSEEPGSRGQWQVPDSRQSYTSTRLEAAQEGLPDCYSQPAGHSTPPLSTSYEERPSSRSSSTPREVLTITPPRSTDGEDDASSTGEAPNEGFYVSFGDQKKRPKPKPVLGLDKRVKRDASRGRDASPAPRQELEKTPPQPAEPSVQPAQPAVPAQPAFKPPAEQDIKGFTLDDNTNSQDESEMQLKREKLQQLQAKRLEEAEKKRLSKESENAKKKEKERLKQEETDRKKAEEKLRKEQIFQQYLQRKKEKEEEEMGISKPKPRQKPENGTHGRGSRPRPKSMFVKATDTPDSKNSSTDDLSTSGESSAMRTTPRSLRLSTSRLRLPNNTSNNRMRKAVSCNTLNQNISTPGGATYRRPASPDLFRSRKPGDGDGFGNLAAGGDYAGPKLFVKPSSKSNRNLIINAISHCCLAGIVNNDVKNKVLEEIARSSAKHFIILFRDAGLQYRGLYTFEPETEEIFKLYGSGPRYLHNKTLEKYYKYNSGSKSFSEIQSTKHLSVSIDAVVPSSMVWKATKPTGMVRR